MPNMMIKVTVFIAAYRAKYGRDPPYIELSTSEMQSIIEQYSVFYEGSNIDQITTLLNIPVKRVD